MEAVKDNEAGKAKVALISIVLSVIGCVVGLFAKVPLLDAFAPGTLCTLIALPLSLMAVRNHGRNTLALLAFILSNVGVFFTVGMSAMR